MPSASALPPWLTDEANPPPANPPPDPGDDRGLAAGGGRTGPDGFPVHRRDSALQPQLAERAQPGDGQPDGPEDVRRLVLQRGADAAVPGFAIADKFRASAGPTPELCSAELERDFSHGGKKTRAKITFDQKAGTAHRVTMVPDEGGESNLNIPSCARDAVAFAYYARKELGQGRVPQPQQVFLGAGYSVRMDYTGAQNVTLGESKEPVVTDHVAVTVKGPKADFVFEVFFARDAARRPLVVKIPLSLGMLSLELVR